MNNKKRRWKKYKALIFNLCKDGHKEPPFFISVRAANEDAALLIIDRRMRGYQYDVGKVEEDT